MTSVELESTIRTGLVGVPFTGLSVAYCTQARDAIRALVPAGTVIEVYWRGRTGAAELIAEARAGDAVAKLVLPVG